MSDLSVNGKRLKLTGYPICQFLCGCSFLPPTHIPLIPFAVVQISTSPFESANQPLKLLAWTLGVECPSILQLFTAHGKSTLYKQQQCLTFWIVHAILCVHVSMWWCKLSRVLISAWKFTNFVLSDNSFNICSGMNFQDELNSVFKFCMLFTNVICKTSIFCFPSVQ